MTGKFHWSHNRRMDVLDQLAKKFGSYAGVARKFKVTREAIRQWETKGIPADRALEIQELTRGEISAMDVLRHIPKKKKAAA